MEQLDAVLDNIRGGVVICNYNIEKGCSEVEYINRGWTEITGYTREQLTREKGGNPQSLVLAEDKLTTDIEYTEQLRHGNTYELMYRIAHRDGMVRWVIDKGIVSVLPGGVMRNQSIITEVTNIKEQEERMRLLAQVDQLTYLNNKATFTLLAQNILSRRHEQHHVLLSIDIDNFKSFNDSYGHAFGDKVLEAVAGQMKELFRSGDVLGRVGGDEFLTLMVDVPNSKIVENRANHLRTAICEMDIHGVPHVPVTVSIGGALFYPGKTYADLFNEADAALYLAKSGGKNKYVPAAGMEKIN